MMSPAVTFGDLVTRNVFEMIGTISGLLRSVGREIPELSHLKAEYVAKVTAAGSHEEAVRISHEYAYQHLATSLSVREGVEEYEALAAGRLEEAEELSGL